VNDQTFLNEKRLPVAHLQSGCEALDVVVENLMVEKVKASGDPAITGGQRAGAATAVLPDVLRDHPHAFYEQVHAPPGGMEIVVREVERQAFRRWPSPDFSHD
jgi:hypothetical protein